MGMPKVYFSISHVGVECVKYIEVCHFLFKILGVRGASEIRRFGVMQIRKVMQCLHFILSYTVCRVLEIPCKQIIYICGAPGGINKDYNLLSVQVRFY